MNGKQLQSELKKYISKNFGERCKHFELGCAPCMIWAAFDYMFLFDEEVNPPTHKQAKPGFTTYRAIPTKKGAWLPYLKVKTSLKR